MSHQIIRARKEKSPVGEAALTMAIGIIVERIGRLSSEDQKELYELVKGLGQTKGDEDVEAIRVAMREILDDAGDGEPLELNPALPRERPAKLQRWVTYVADKVEQHRKAAGMTQNDLAEKSGLPQSHISRIESAKLSPSRATLEKIAGVFKLPVSEFDPSAY